MQWLLFLAAKTKSRNCLDGERGNPVKGTRLAYFSWLSRCEIVVACDALLPYFLSWCPDLRTGLHIYPFTCYCTGNTLRFNLYLPSNCASWYSPPTTIVKYSPQKEEGSQRKTERKEQSWHSLSLSLSFHGPLSNRQPIRLESRRGKLRRFLREKRIGRRAIDCIYANTFLCAKINIFMHVILHVIVSYHLSFGFEIYYLHTRGSTALVEVNNYIMNR